MNKLKISILRIAEARCELCSHLDEVYLTSEEEEEMNSEAEEFFSNEKWEVIDNKMLCHHCVKIQRQLD